MHRGTALALVAVFVLPGSARSEPIAAADQAAIHAVITDQIDAFRRDDWDAAYGFASPGIRTLYPTVDSFAEMITHNYQPVYRPQSVVFGEVIEASQGPVQRVYVTGPDGSAYVANYAMRRDADGKWTITSSQRVRA